MTEKKKTTEEKSGNGLNLKETTVKELGLNLPLGISDGADGLVKSFALRPWRFKEEKELGELAEKNPDANLAQHVAMVVATMCTRLGPHNFEEMKWEEKLVHLGQMWMGDVFYIYILLRMQSLGGTLELRPKCATCRKEFDFDGILKSIRVLTGSVLSDALWNYKLEAPFEIRGKKAETLIMGPPRWNVLEMMDEAAVTNSGLRKAGIIIGAIHGVEGEEHRLVLSESDIEEMTKKDIEELSEKIDKNSAGPDMFIEGKCPQLRCRSEFKQVIDWRYDNFFGVSSR